VDKTLLFAGFHSRHDLQFFEKRKYQRFLRSSRQEIGSKNAKMLQFTGVWYQMVPSRWKKSAPKSGQHTAIYSVSCLPRFLDIPKTV